MKSFLKEWISNLFIVAVCLIGGTLVVLTGILVLLIPFFLEKYMGFGWAMTIFVVAIAGAFSLVMTALYRRI